MEVNDDSVVLKGGKGPWADEAVENGSNERILVEDCVYGFCHGCLTCGSESVHNRNILVRRIEVKEAMNLMWLKMRPDTPQHYEYICMEDVNAKVIDFINIRPWTQFFDLKGREDIPISVADNIIMRRINCQCDTFFDVVPNDEQYKLQSFVFEDLNVKAVDKGAAFDAVTDIIVENVNIEIEEKESFASKHPDTWNKDRPWEV